LSFSYCEAGLNNKKIGMTEGLAPKKETELLRKSVNKDAGMYSRCKIVSFLAMTNK
jgi:hypothetical protein